MTKEHKPIDTTSGLKPRQKPKKDPTKLIELNKFEKLFSKIRKIADTVFSAILTGVEDAKKKYNKTKWQKAWDVVYKVLTIVSGWFSLKQGGLK